MVEIHDRTPITIAPEAAPGGISEEPDPWDLLRPYRADEMTMGPISTRVNRPAMISRTCSIRSGQPSSPSAAVRARAM